ncbi:MAG: hypothetical protein COW85_13140 [Ignavibacteria bacterium CG22_combo_CG10-13_8_21_14_all_37_15]|nr:MAG: hypothetical protein COW85_13140 [Ignavibacteria bacterium CG22_combo_CG10-13_8_21_14_all_37_15]
MRRIFLLMIPFSFFFVIGCSSSEEQTKEEKEIQKEEYVFDASGVDSTESPSEVLADVPAEQPVKKFSVQLGAFSTKAKADEFVALSKKKLAKELIVSYSEEFKLYVVQLPPFASKAEAESVRNVLWNSKDFKDAFIVVNP